MYGEDGDFAGWGRPFDWEASSKYENLEVFADAYVRSTRLSLSPYTHHLLHHIRTPASWRYQPAERLPWCSE